MKKYVVGLGALLLATAGFAASLDNTTWRTTDDETGKPKAIVKFQQQSNGTYTASIQTLLDPNAKKTCTACKGANKNKDMVGLQIVSGLKEVKPNVFEGGKILDPKKGKDYNLSAELKDNGKRLDLRGYMGVSLLGRNQIWHRVN